MLEWGDQKKQKEEKWTQRKSEREAQLKAEGVKVDSEKTTQRKAKKEAKVNAKLNKKIENYVS